MFSKALTATIFILLAAVFYQPAPQPAAPARVRATIWTRNDDGKWQRGNSEAILETGAGRVWMYVNAEKQIVLMHLGDKYLVPTKGYPGNMIVSSMTWDEREAKQ
jgi:hypothetical protein